MDVQRWSLQHWMVKDNNGEYVRHSDHIAALSEAQTEIERLKAEVSQLSEEVNNARETMHGEMRYNTELRNRVKELGDAMREIEALKQRIKELEEGNG